MKHPIAVAFHISIPETLLSQSNLRTETNYIMGTAHEVRERNTEVEDIFERQIKSLKLKNKKALKCN